MSSPIQPEDPERNPAPRDGNRSFPVVGIGASAGGIEAIARLLRVLPVAPGLAVVVVQHLDPGRPSILAGIFQRSCAIPVVEASSGSPIEVDHVYVIPPNVSLVVEEGSIVLRPRVEYAGQFMPIDALFRSMAQDLGRRAIGVLLSGGGTDGTLGLEEIKGEGGITLAQDESALHDSMPRSAIGVGCVDYVLDPEAIAAELLRVSGELFRRASSNGKRIGELAKDSKSLQALFELVQESQGIDFSLYKRSTMLRRIQRRMALVKVERLDDYIELLRDAPPEAKALADDFLIRVTSFFRDPAAFDALKRTVFPALLRQRVADEPIRLWVAGCATGEEVYSLAIALLESIGDMASNTPIKILATDLSEAALERARSGRYIENIAIDVSAERLRRFFFKVDGHYQVSKSIRDSCVFSRHNLIKDPPFANLDLVSCRNVLIYFTLALQRRVVPHLHYALKPGGQLVLGSSESLGSFPELFGPVHLDAKIYQKKATPSRHLLDFGAPARALAPGGGPDSELALRDAQREADRILLSRYSPPGLLIDDNLTILQFRGQTGPFLEPSPGAPSFDLQKMVRLGLLGELRATIDRARSEGRGARSGGVLFEDKGGFRNVTIEVVSLRPPPSGLRLYLILFLEGPGGPPDPRRPEPSAEGADLAQLRLELESSRQYIRSLAELHERDYERSVAAGEEALASYEELQSTNEELQSTNEELQTAKEEVQSTNEELMTVDEELRHRNHQVSAVNDELVNLITGLSIPVVMVARDLRIRRFTPSAEQVLNLISTDVGRPIGDIRTNLEMPDLEETIGEVLATLSTREREVRDRSGRWYSIRIRPYITAEGGIDGAAIAIFDVDALKRASEQLRAARDYAEAIVEAVWVPLVVVDREMRVRRANQAFFRTFRLNPQEVEGRPLSELGSGRWWDLEPLKAGLDDVFSGDIQLRDFEIEGEVPPMGRRTFLLSTHKIRWDGHGAEMILLAMDDVTQRRREAEQGQLLASEMAARAEAETANRNKDEFLAMLAHELRNPLAPVLNSLLVLRSPGRTEGDVSWASGIMERQVRHMVRLVDDLLDVSRITQGKVELRRERVELAPLIEHAVETIRPTIEERHHTLGVALPDGPIWLDADPARIEQVVANLLNNAAKYTDDGGRIRLSAEVRGDDVVIRVEDTGLGIAPDLLPRVFDLFMQADQSLDRARGGLGIGLTLVRTLVGLHGGSIVVDSPGVGRGSTFTVKLPVTRRPAPARRGAGGSKPAAATPRRILVVDDNVDSALTLERLLERNGHAVEVAHDGPGGLEGYRAHRPEVVLLDIGLPGIDGYELARRIRAEPPGDRRPLLVALTGYGQGEDIRKSLEAGFDYHLTKPVDFGELMDLLGRS